jgi:hypothetical protein
MSTMDYKEEAKFCTMEPEFDENRFEVGENFILHS